MDGGVAPGAPGAAVKAAGKKPFGKRPFGKWGLGERFNGAAYGAADQSPANPSLDNPAPARGSSDGESAGPDYRGGGADDAPRAAEPWGFWFGRALADMVDRLSIQSLRTFGLRGWRLDRASVAIAGETLCRWRAVDRAGKELKSFVTRSEDRDAAFRFLRDMIRRGDPEILRVMTVNELLCSRGVRSLFETLIHENKVETAAELLEMLDMERDNATAVVSRILARPAMYGFFGHEISSHAPE
jgi:hypothetical protein